MANPNRGQVALKSGDREYMLSYSVNSLCELEDELELPIASIVTTMQNPEKLRMKYVRALMWAGLQDRHDDVSIIDAGLIIGDVGMQSAMEAIRQAFKLAFPDAPKGAKTPKNPPKAEA